MSTSRSIELNTLTTPSTVAPSYTLQPTVTLHGRTTQYQSKTYSYWCEVVSNFPEQQSNVYDNLIGKVREKTASLNRNCKYVKDISKGAEVAWQEFENLASGFTDEFDVSVGVEKVKKFCK
ncbi:hypothetical protein I302_107860 [Kwoniella bestiolae CBS 10118]|uniref:Uncharacterized protein n=1 Tax=Kwoniella bestiolae CBS 10118 TaxID=1296100 RepID=A0A1B9FXB6_9TREE|nr:hypothetical protein I302_06399 [Kwoniella bestiolae CBS 10118]OCF23418.1 hypothetical protein I302_06399 [Kwoniella bestiolae CBS 10118]